MYKSQKVTGKYWIPKMSLNETGIIIKLYVIWEGEGWN